MPPIAPCTVIRRVDFFTAFMTVTATCHSTSFVAVICWRRSNIDASAGAREEIARIVSQIRSRWPKVEIWLPADSGFAREELMAWCEENDVDYVFGLARNERLVAQIGPELKMAEREAKATGAARYFKEFMWETLESWSRKRRVIAKAELTKGEANPRFIVTSLHRSEAAAQGTISVRRTCLVLPLATNVCLGPRPATTCRGLRPPSSTPQQQKRKTRAWQNPLYGGP
jgi:Transposase DDE domain group 1